MSWYCDVADPSSARQIVATGQCPAEKDDPITGDRLTDPMVFFCDEGQYKRQKQHIKCYNKSTIRNMYERRGSVPFVEPTSRGQFTSSALSEIKSQLGIRPQFMTEISYRPRHVVNGRMTREDFFNAVTIGNTSAVKRYLDQGGAVNARDFQGNTALMKAAFQGHLAIVMTLAMYGADLNARNHAGMTALMAAAAGGHYNVVDFLLKSGANPRLRMDDGRTAYELAHVTRVRHILDEPPAKRRKPSKRKKTPKRRKSKRKKSPKRRKSKRKKSPKRRRSRKR